MKKCSKCCELKEFNEFNKRKTSSDGYNSQCKICAYSYKPKKEIRIKKYDNPNDRKKAWYLKNREKDIESSKRYREKNKERLKEYRREYKKNRLKHDIVYKMSYKVRGLIGKTFNRKGYTKKSKTQEILGCSFDEFKQYLETKFESWMNWENRGLYNGTPNNGWDIDHIIPISTAITEEDVIRLNHYSNLQPLCSYVNRDIKKGIMGV